MSGNGTVMNEWKFREQMCEIGRRIYNKGFAAANDGNISLRLGEDRVLCSPTRVSKGFMKPDDLCIVDLDGKQVSGKRKRSSEILLHLTIMKARADVRSVVHCHPPHATAFAVAREPIPKCILPEIEVFLGEVAISPYETPGAPVVRRHGAALTSRTPTRSCWPTTGPSPTARDLEDAYFKTEIIDAYCRILILAKQIGRVNYYTDEKAAELIRLKPKLGIPDPRLERGLENCDLCGNSLFREGYGEPSPEPRVFIHPKIAGSEPVTSPIEACLTPLAADISASRRRRRHRRCTRELAGQAIGQRSGASRLDRPGGPVQAITDQVMQALNGTVQVEPQACHHSASVRFGRTTHESQHHRRRRPGRLVGGLRLQCGGVVSQIDLIDLNADQVRGQALDLLHGASLVADQRIRATGYEAIPESDVDHHHGRPAPQARREPARPDQPQRRAVPGHPRPGHRGRPEARRHRAGRLQPGRCLDLSGRPPARPARRAR